MSQKPKAITWKENANGCWICDSHIGPEGYPSIRINGEKRRISRIFYEYIHGRIPKGMIILHSCDTPSCIRPTHLSLGTDLDNAIDRNNKNRQARGEHHGRSKLTAEMVKQIRQDGGTIRELGKKYGVSHSQIVFIKHKKQWKHVA